MQQIDPSLATPSPVSPETLREPAGAPEERHWAMAVTPIFWLVAGPLALCLDYLRWNSSDNPFKGPYWHGGRDFAVVLWLGFLLFSTAVCFALGDFERLFRHLFRRSRN